MKVKTSQDLIDYIKSNGAENDDGVIITPWQHRVFDFEPVREDKLIKLHSYKYAYIPYAVSNEEGQIKYKTFLYGVETSMNLIQENYPELLGLKIDAQRMVDYEDRNWDDFILMLSNNPKLESEVLAKYGRNAWNGDEDDAIYETYESEDETVNGLKIFPLKTYLYDFDDGKSLIGHSSNSKKFYSLINISHSDIIETYGDVRKYDCIGCSHSRAFDHALVYGVNEKEYVTHQDGEDAVHTRVYEESMDEIVGYYETIDEGENVTPLFNTNKVWCDDCSTYYTEHYGDSEGAYDESRGEWVCANCMDDLVWCEHCDTYHHNEYVRYDRHDSAYCNSCWENRQTFIHEYTYRPDLNFWDWKNGSWCRSIPSTLKKRIDRLYYGTELEVEMSSSSNYGMQDIAEEIVGGERYLYAKEDGSLDDGFEIVSHPMTFEAFQKFNWEGNVLSYKGNIRGYRTSTAGMHVHMSRSAFTDNHLLKFMTMIYEYKSFSHLIAQRPSTDAYNRWSKFKAGTIELTKHYMTKDVKRKHNTLKSGGGNLNKHCTLRLGEKYVPVNISNGSTIEVRIFKSNLNEVSFRKNVEFCDALYHFTFTRAHYDLKLDKFVSYIRKQNKRYTNLNAFLDARQGELNEILKFPLSTPDGLEIS